MKRPSIRNQYPRDMVKPAGMKNDVNTMRSIKRKYETLNSTWVASPFNCRTINIETNNFLKDDDIADDVD